MSGVAITGMSCLFPGAPDLDAYWRNILGKVDAVSDPPPEAWDPDVYYDPEFKNQDATYCKRGGYLGSLATFDPLAHGIPPVAVGGEPDQWLALRIAQAALSDAHATELADEVRERTAIVLGKGTYLNGGNAVAVQRGLVIGQTVDLVRSLHPEHTEEELEELRGELAHVLPPLGPETVPGLIPNIVVGRIANRLDLMGAAYTVDAACASSLVAVQQAIRDLLAGHCDLALAGGSQVWMPVPTLNLFCRLGALSRREELRPFDREADGTLLGEGIGMVVLKRLADARADGDRIYAVIRGVGVSSDGRGAAVMAPRVEGEELALRRAYAEAGGVSPGSVGLLEAHGTGTPVGDAAEVEALRRVFGERDGGLPTCAIGSVKSMISHTIPAAGVAGLIKTALALYHRVLPPTLHCEEPNPELGLERTPFYVNTETRPWIHGGSEPRRAGVNAFGFGGINAHAVLEEPEGVGVDHRPPWDSEVYILESDSRAGLREQAARLAAALEREPACPADLAFTLACRLGQVERPQRLAIVATSLGDLREKLGQALEKLGKESCTRIKTVSGIYYASEPLGRDAKLVFVFPGEGAQYPNMLADLCLHFSEVREVFDRIDRLYAGHPRGDLLSDWVFPRPAFSEEERRRADERLMQMDIAVESVLTANGAMHALLSRLVRRVDAVIGHSTGEHSAALVTGVLDLGTDERLREFSLGLYRAYAEADSRHDVPGAVLLAIGADADRAEEIARDAGGELHLAMDNCPHQAVLVGEAGAAARAREIAARAGLVCEELPYDRAVHTPMFAPFADDLRAVFAEVPIGGGGAGLWSCTTAAPYPKDSTEGRELMVEHWTSPVRFRETIDALYEDGARVFVEVGPRGNMTAFIEDILRGRPHCAVASNVQRRSGVTQLNHLVGRLAVHDVDLDVGHLFAERNVGEIELQAPSETPDRGSAQEIALSTAWPMLRLAPDALDRIRSSAPVPIAQAAPAAPAAAPAAAATVVAAASDAAPLTIAPGPADETAGVIDRHFRTMERFLDAGEQVMNAYLTGAAPVAVEEARRPLVGTIVAWDPGVELLARRVFDPAQDRYLLDHTLGREVSQADPALHAPALMPLAMSMEILAEGAACLVPDLTVTGMRDVAAHRWLAWDDDPQTLELHARRVGPEEVRVELRPPGANGAGPAVEGTVLLGRAFPEPPPPLAVPDDERPSRWTPDALYRDVMFHQGAWRAVRAVDGVAPRGARARLEVPPADGLLTGVPDTAFVLDPAVLDAAGQVIGFWAADLLDDARVVFPFRLARLDLHGPRRRTGEELGCVAAIELTGERLVRADIDVLDRDDRPWMRLTGWEDRRFGVPERFAPLSLPTRLAPLASPWDAPLAGHQGAAACRRLDARLPADAGLWTSVWAGRVLGRRERSLFAGLRLPERRRLEWLGARTAAKEAVADILREHAGLDPPPADIEILPGEDGAPLVESPGGSVVVSVAHSDGECVALAALGAARVGIDVERVRELPAGFAEAALTEDERRLLPPNLAGDLLLRCWCAKEAAGKAVGSGMASGPDRPTLVAVEPDRERVTVTVGGRQLVARTVRDGDLIAASAWEES